MPKKVKRKSKKANVSIVKEELTSKEKNALLTIAIDLRVRLNLDYTMNDARLNSVVKSTTRERSEWLKHLKNVKKTESKEVVSAVRTGYRRIKRRNLELIDLLDKRTQVLNAFRKAI